MDTEKKSNGALIGLIVVIIILVVGGIYLWMKNRISLTEPANVTTEDGTALDTLDKDIGGTDTNVGVDVNAVE